MVRSVQVHVFPLLGCARMPDFHHCLRLTGLAATAAVKVAHQRKVKSKQDISSLCNAL
jgi:hypothetical protein